MLKKLFWKVGKITPAIATVLLLFVPKVKANQYSTIKNLSSNFLAQTVEKDNQYNNNLLFLENNSFAIGKNYRERKLLAQLTNVDRLRDVSPTDWAYEALRSLIDRYNCIVGYPERMYRGTKALSRYEFATGLNTCLNQIELLISSDKNVSRKDLNTLMRLMQEFSEELAILRGRTDGVQARVGELEVTQFSTTTKLRGEVIFGLASIFSGEADEVSVLGHRTRLELETSFTGEDTLFSRLATGNFPSFTEETGTFEGNLGFAAPEDNNLALEVLFYNFPLSENTEVIVGAAGTAADDIANTVNVLDGDGGNLAISAFGTRNPIYLPPADAGIGIIHNLGDKFEISAGYLASPANNPSEGNGLFNGPFSALGQILYKPTDDLTLAATYVRGYNQSDTGTGSSLANLRSFTKKEFGEAVPTVSDSYALQASWAISDRVILGGWGTLSQIEVLGRSNGIEGSQDVINWAATLAFPDLGKEGSLAGIVIGREPYVSDSSIDALGKDEDFSLHVEGFYQYQITDNISITPGVVWITAPDSKDSNDDLVIGTVRTTFSF
ncbi:MAG: iron uptake porin [Xenococcaceae cyanobacterium MO_188.B32]|nr:iron uptake porin [Xenococcaceae cyanobacterium MO_188.B32]